MGSLTQISFLSHILIHLLALTLTFAQPHFLFHNCSNSVNYTIPSTFQTNLNTLLSSLSSNIDAYGFYNSSMGRDPDRASAVALCRGDVELDICRSCVTVSTSKLIQLCPNQREAIGYYDNCMLRYSNNETIFGKMAWGPGFEKWNTNNVSDEQLSKFNEVRSRLFGGLINRAASGDSRRKYATGEAQLPDSKTIYALVQCTPDLSESDCSFCLNATLERIPSCCSNRIGGAVYKPTCNIRYELDKFYNDTKDAAAPSPQLAAGPSNNEPMPNAALPPPLAAGPSNNAPPLSGMNIVIVSSIVIFVTL
ncbi:hypothetical protein F0562_014243 [Nyssa sinensis]|uniref:Gnk2-homologous domain-containing protein n=1 Tax=Nyssa sinensis TaxID=561372 RepID=A0A5J4ZS62_9ASTE|nr:hypothetical protein F0562_014243 [Nyssa sinensis]